MDTYFAGAGGLFNCCDLPLASFWFGCWFSGGGWLIERVPAMVSSAHQFLFSVTQQTEHRTKTATQLYGMHGRCFFLDLSP